MFQHPLNHKAAWARLALGLALAVFGILTQFDVTINQNTVKAANVSSTASFPAVKRAWITEAACRGIKSGTKLEDLEDRFQGDSDEFGIDMPLAEDQRRSCMAWTDYNDKVDRVTMDLMVD